MSHLSVSFLTMSAGVLWLLSGCQGNLERTWTEGPGTSPADMSSVIPEYDMMPGRMTQDSLPDPDAVGTLPLKMLTAQEYAYTIEQMLGVDASELIRAFPSEISGDSGWRTVGRLSEVHVERYQSAAEGIAALSQSQARADLLECVHVDEACISAFITHHGERLFRRPLDAQEREEFKALFELGRTGEIGLDGEGALGLVLEAMLQSPFFLYHWERSHDEELASGPQRLDAWQLASRLSYFLWRSAPDDTLRALAASGALLEDATLEREARRLLEHPRAERAIVDTFVELFHLDAILELPKHPGLYPDFDERTRRSVLESARRFFAHMIFEQEGSYAAMLTSSAAHVDVHLAALYDLDPGLYGEELVLAQLPEGRRAGMLTLPAMLAVHADAAEGNPIFRGVALQNQVLCTEIPPPKGNVPPLPSGEGGETLRERVTFHTAQVPCSGCHALINPAGFAFGHYDAIGAWQDTEGSHPIDASSSLTLPGDVQPSSFDGALQLAQLIAAHPSPYACLARQLSQLAYSRKLQEADAHSMLGVMNSFKPGEDDIQELLVALVMSRSFRYADSPTSPE